MMDLGLLMLQDMEKERETLQVWKKRVEQELDRVIAFWMEHSHDQEHGYGCIVAYTAVLSASAVLSFWMQQEQVVNFCCVMPGWHHLARNVLLC